MKSVSSDIDDELKARVQTLADMRRRSPDWVIREAVRSYVDREEARESFKQDALASWAEYQKTGRHLTGEDVAAWLATWGTDDEAGPPECHG